MMRHLFLSTPALVFLAACATTSVEDSAQVAAAEVSGADLISADLIESHVRYLSHDRLEGREAGTAGYDMAAEYVAEQYAALGLEPAAADGSYFEPVPLRVAKVTIDSAAFTVDGEPLVFLQDYVMVPNAGYPDVSAIGDAVFVGYAIDDEALGINSFAEADLEGKIAVFVPGVPKGVEGGAALQLGTITTKVDAAAANGAAGAVMLLGEDLSFYSYQQIAQYVTGGTMNLASSNSSGPSTVYAILSTSSADSIFLEARMSLEDVYDVAREGGELPTFALDREISLSLNTLVEEITSDNVVAILPGSDPELAGESVVVTAHLDHIGRCRPPEEEDSICNGALDNASGIAIMLETARALVGSERPRRSIVFAALTAEEKGLLGAEYLVGNPPAAFGEMVANVNIDMPILRYEFNDMVAFGAEHSSLGPVAAQAAERAGMFLSPDPVPEENLFTRSDHYRFVQAGIPALFLVAGFSSPDEADDGGAAFRRFLRSDYHGVNDEPDYVDERQPEMRPLNWEMGAKFARVNYEIITAIANADHRPVWNDESPYNPENR